MLELLKAYHHCYPVGGRGGDGSFDDSVACWPFIFPKIAGGGGG